MQDLAAYRVATVVFAVAITFTNITTPSSSGDVTTADQGSDDAEPPKAAPPYEPTTDTATVDQWSSKELHDAAILVQRYVVDEYKDTHAGVRIVNDDDGRIEVAVSEAEHDTTDAVRERIRAEIPGSYPLSVIRNEHSMTELRTAQRAFVNDMQASNDTSSRHSSGIREADTAINIEENSLFLFTRGNVETEERPGSQSEVERESQAEAAVSEELQVPIVVYEDAAGSDEQSADCERGRADCFPDMIGGLRIVHRGEACTSGFAAYGPASGRSFVLTAGHCADGVAGTIWLNGGEPYGQGERPTENGYIDAQRIALTSLRWVNQGEIWADSDIRPVRSYIRWEDVVVGEGNNVGVSGQATGTGRAAVTTKYWTSYGVSRQIALSDQNVGDLCTDNGDSGAPYFRYSSAIAIHHGSNRDNAGCSDEYRAFGSSIEYVIDRLNLELTYAD